MTETRQKKFFSCSTCRKICAESSCLKCAECNKIVHPSCENLDRVVKLAKTYSWLCADCKRCEECRYEGNENNIVLCDWCDRGFHTHCLKPPLSSIPIDDWKCPVCKERIQKTEEGDGKDESKTTRSVRRTSKSEGLRRRSPSFSSSVTGLEESQSSKKRRRRNYSEFYNVSHIKQKSPSPSTSASEKSDSRSQKCATDNCPVDGCNGEGHLSGKYPHHSFREACPLYHNMTVSDCQSFNLNAKQPAKVEEEPYNLRGPSKDPRSLIKFAEEEREGFDKSLHKKLTKGSSNLSETLTFADRSCQPILNDFATSRDFDLFRKAQIMLADDMERHSDLRNKVTNRIKFVRMGSYEMETFYPSPYPDDVARFEKLYVCEYCLKYIKSLTQLRNHAAKCTLSHPPGKEIYKKNSLSVYEVDGSTNKIFCQNLCLLAKLFLDHKTLYYDVEPFLFYILTETDDDGCHMIGYFSKEKNSVMNCNLSCLLTFPPYQRKGYGRMLIEFSYLLSRLEDKIGSPEHPLSDMGLIAYRGYWKDKILEYMISKDEQPFSVKDLSQKTGIHVNDIISTLQYYGLVKYWRGEYWIMKNQELMDKYKKVNRKKQAAKTVVEPSCLKWPSAKLENLSNLLNN